MTEEKRTRVKVGVAIIVCGGRIGYDVLMAKRKGAHGSGQWSFPGGKVDPGESSVQTAKRELFEETGLIVEEKDFQYVMSNLHYFPEIDTEYVTIFFKVDRDAYFGGIEVKEPEKIDGDWEWITPGKWPFPLFEPVTKLVEEGRMML